MDSRCQLSPSDMTINLRVVRIDAFDCGRVSGAYLWEARDLRSRQIPCLTLRDVQVGDFIVVRERICFLDRRD